MHRITALGACPRSSLTGSANASSTPYWQALEGRSANRAPDAGFRHSSSNSIPTGSPPPPRLADGFRALVVHGLARPGTADDGAQPNRSNARGATSNAAPKWWTSSPAKPAVRARCRPHVEHTADCRETNERAIATAGAGDVIVIAGRVTSRRRSSPTASSCRSTTLRWPAGARRGAAALMIFSQRSVRLGGAYRN